MVSPELLRRYPFFAAFTPDQLTTLAMAAEEMEVPGGHRFCNEGEELRYLYLVLDGSVEVTLTLPEKGSRSVLPPPAGQAREITLSVVRPSEIFAWSALVPPYQATSNVVAAEDSRVVALDAAALRQRIESDPSFGCQLLLRVAQIARDRIQDLHLEALASAAR